MNIDEINEVFADVNTKIASGTSPGTVDGNSCESHRKEMSWEEEFIKYEAELIFKSIDALRYKERTAVYKAVSLTILSGNEFSTAVKSLSSYLRVYFHALMRLYELNNPR